MKSSRSVDVGFQSQIHQLVALWLSLSLAGSLAKEEPLRTMVMGAAFMALSDPGSLR